MYELLNFKATRECEEHRSLVASAELIFKQKKGDYVQLVFQETVNGEPWSESMWVKITKFNIDGTLSGILDNDPKMLRTIKCGDKVQFHVDNVRRVMISGMPYPFPSIHEAAHSSPH